MVRLTPPEANGYPPKKKKKHERYLLSFEIAYAGIVNTTRTANELHGMNSPSRSLVLTVPSVEPAQALDSKAARQRMGPWFRRTTPSEEEGSV